MAVRQLSKPTMTQHFLPTSLRAAIIASSYWVLSLSLTVVSGSVASFVGCLFACYLVDLGIHRSPLKRLRTFSVNLLSLSFLLLGLSLAALVSSTALFSDLASPIASFNTSEFIKWFAISASLTVCLRILAQRTNYGAVLEIIFVATAFVITLSAHRNGMIHRPYFIGDYALVRGIDPSSILMAFGSGAVLSLAALLMIENNHRRLPYHFTVLGLLCFSLLFYVRLFGLPTPQLTDDLGLTGQEQAGNGAQRENPFRDSENNADDKEAPVAVVVFRDDYEPLNGSYYFRESAYSQFNGTMLDFTTRDDMDQDLIEGFTNSRIETNQLPKAEDQRVPVRASIGMLISHRTPFGLESPIAYEDTANPNNLRFKRTYDSYSLAPEYDFNYLLGRELGRADWSQEVWDEYLELPDDPRYQELAQSLIADLKPEYSDDPFAKAWAVKTYLDENGIYSLKNEHAYETDPAGSFLFGDLTGYCMHFSFAATYMFRSLGIPARVGIGYSVPASNKAGGSSLLIQAVHGHAWPEVYFRDIGWVIVDPAPQQTLVDMTTDPQNNLQQLLGDMLRNDASFDDFLQSQQTSYINVQLLLNIVYSLILATLLTAYSIKFYRIWIPSRGALDNQYRLSYRAMLDQLAAIGLYRQFGESRESFAKRVQAVSPSMQLMTDRHLALALGAQDPSRFDAKNWTELRTAIATEISQNTQPWKKVIAWINPLSWLFSK
ncbi:MAG: transglutaminase-like domain-containing protein [Pseudohongiellaceae bacterium]